MPNTEELLRRLVAAFLARDEQSLGEVLADDLTAYVTNGEGGVDRVDGRNSYVERLLTLQAPKLEIDVTQSVTIAADEALAMVEIHAERNERTLHNFAAFIARERDGQIFELWMVDAKPAYSDEFWR